MTMPAGTAPEDFLAAFRLAEATVRCPGAAALARDPGFVGKVRGALGTRLHEVASDGARAGRACDFATPCAYRMLWGPSGEVRPGFPMPHPFVIVADPAGPDLAVTVRLFGAAAGYVGEVADALVRAIRGGLSLRQALDVTDRRLTETEGLADPGVTAAARLDFATPLVIRNSAEGAHVAPPALVRGLVHRADGMARWHGARLDLDFPALLAAADAIEGAWHEARAVRWQRGARRQGKLLPMEGVVGCLALRGDLAPFSWVLALGQVIHAGSRTSWGLGRYLLSPVV